MKIYTMIEFEYSGFPYTKNGINIISIENIKIIDDDLTYFLDKYSSLASISSYNYNGENYYKCDKDYIYTSGIYKNTENNKYYILSIVDAY